MNKGKKWYLVDLAVTGVGLLAGLVGLYTNHKSETYLEEQRYKDLEDRYGLVPVKKED